MAMVSCTEDYTDWANPQINPEEEAVAFGNGSVTPVDVINLANVTEEKIQVASIVAPTSSDAGYTPTIKINLGDKTYDIDNDGKMATADLASYISETYGKRPIEHDINATLDAWFNNGSTVVKMATSETFQVKAIPVAPVIDEGYYLVGDMFNAEGVDGWNTVSAKQAFMHSDKDVYDDPKFTITFETKKADQYWKIIPKKNIDAGNFWADGVVGPKENGSSSMEGDLTNVGPGAGIIKEPGKYVLTLNMMDYSYTIKAAPELYMKGDANGWDGYDYLTGDGVHFTGFMYLNQNGFKFSTQPNWDGTNYGADFDTAPDAKNIVITEPAGYYQVDVDLSKKTYTLTPFTIGIIGNATPKGWDGDTNMTYNPEERCWELKNVTLTDGEMKFRHTNDWSLSWGGELDNLTTQNGPNIAVAAGTYDIKLVVNWAEGTAKCVMTKK